MGRPRTSTATLKSRGTYRKDRHDCPGEVQYPPGKPTCPNWLTKEAKAEWRRVVKQLGDVGLLADVDRALLVAYCEAWGEFALLSREIDEYGRTYSVIGDRVKTHPRVTMRNAAFDRLIKVAAQFGFSPATRARLKAHPPQTQDNGNEEPELYKIRG